MHLGLRYAWLVVFSPIYKPLTPKQLLTLDKLYGFVEVVTGSIKILFLAAIIVTLIAINIRGKDFACCCTM